VIFNSDRTRLMTQSKGNNPFKTRMPSMSQLQTKMKSSNIGAEV